MGLDKLDGLDMGMRVDRCSSRICKSCASPRLVFPISSFPFRITVISRLPSSILLEVFIGLQCSDGCGTIRPRCIDASPANPSRDFHIPAAHLRDITFPAQRNPFRYGSGSTNNHSGSRGLLDGLRTIDAMFDSMRGDMIDLADAFMGSGRRR